MRREKNTVDYFPHDTDASDRTTLTILWNKYGYDGYGFWFKLLECLGRAENHYIVCETTQAWQFFLAKCGVSTGNMHITTEEKAIEILGLLASLDAIDAELWKNNKVIWSQNFVDNVKDAYKNRRRDPPDKPIFEATKKITTGNKGLTTDGKQQKKGKEKKGNKEDANFFEVFWTEYPKKKGKVKAEQAFNREINEQNGDKAEFVDMLLKAISVQKDSEDWIHDDGKYIPHPEAWINGKRWLDEEKEVKKSRYQVIEP